MYNYYVFLCLDNIPFLELILDHNKKGITNYEIIKWEKMKYIILNFKSKSQNEKTLIQKGKIMDKNEVLTKQLSYFQINIKNVHKMIKQKNIKLSKEKQKIIEISEKLFYEEPLSFVTYIKEKKLFNNQEIKKFEETLKLWEEENEMLKSWQILKEQKK